MNELWKDNLNVLLEEGVEDQVEDELQAEGINNKGSVPEKKLFNGSGYHGPTNENVRSIIQEALKEHGDDRLRQFICDRCEQMVLTHFRKVQESALKTKRTPM